MVGTRLVPDVRRSAVATRAVFAGNGALFASWVSRIPAVRDQLHADEQGLGLALLCVGLGSLVAMPFSGRMVARYGDRGVLQGTAVIACVAFPLLGFVPSLWWLGAVLFVMGGAYGVWDVAMNVAGSAVERASGRVLMPGFHAWWSLGGVTGAGVGALAARAGLAPGVHFLLVAVVILGATLTASVVLPDSRGEEDPDDGAAPPARTRLLSDPRIVALGLLTFCAAWAEGSANDWLALLLADERGATEAVAAVGFGVFAAAMTVGRLAGGRVVTALGRVAALRAGAVLAAAGVVLLLVVTALPAAFVGALAWGIGISIGFPLAMTAAGETPRRGPQAIAAVSTIGYLGFLVGPPLIGSLAHALGLGNALWLVVALAAGVALLSGSARPLGR